MIQATITKFFGYDKYVLFQYMGNFLMGRFKCFFYQYSGILNQHKAEMMCGKPVSREMKIQE